MSAMKDLMMNIEEATWDALERGARTKEDVFQYVVMTVPFATESCRGYVYNLLGSTKQYSYKGLYAEKYATSIMH